jgi:hypothetical protein
MGIWLQSLRLTGYRGRIVFILPAEQALAVPTDAQSYLKASGAEIVGESWTPDGNTTGGAWAAGTDSIAINRFWMLHSWLRKETKIR